MSSTNPINPLIDPAALLEALASETRRLHDAVRLLRTAAPHQNASPTVLVGLAQALLETSRACAALAPVRDEAMEKGSFLFGLREQALAAQRFS